MGRKNAANDVRLPAASTIVTTTATSAAHAPPLRATPLIPGATTPHPDYLVDCAVGTL